MTMKTPGVCIVENNAFPNSIVEVATAVPAFISYTGRAVDPLEPPGMPYPQDMAAAPGQDTTFNLAGIVYRLSRGPGAAGSRFLTYQTMTPEDIVESILRVTLLVAINRPAEFIEITFQQRMQNS